jgi:hypothetical protein
MHAPDSLRALLNVSADASTEQWQEIYESKIFEARNDMLQKFAVPSLIRKKNKSLEALVHAENESSYSTHETPFSSSALADKIEFLERYEEKMSELRLALTAADSFTKLSKIAASLALQQDYYMMLFTLYFSEHYRALPEEVNTRDMIDTGKLILQLKAGNPDDKMSWEIEKELARIQKIHQLL